MGTQRRTAFLLSLLAVCVVASLVVILLPAWVIRPFRAQGAAELSASLAMRRMAPLVTATAFVAGALALLYLRPRGWKRLGGGIFLLLILALAASVSRVNYFELMFRPDPNPRFVPVTQAPLEPDDTVLVARSGGEARAYPVRFMGYHHLVNDVLGGVPLVATY